MFGIGLPELILILALALIVVGPDKLPDLARSVAKGILDLKKTANTLKESLTEDGNPLDDIKPELEKAAKALKNDVLGDSDDAWQEPDRKMVYDPQDTKENSSASVIDIEPEPEPEPEPKQSSEITTENEVVKPEPEQKKPMENGVDNSKTEEINRKKENVEQLN